MSKKLFFLIAFVTLNTIITMAQVNWQFNPVGAIFAREGGETPEGTYKFSCGGYEIYTIISADKSYQPASLYYGENESDRSIVDQIAPDGKVATSMNCFIVKNPQGYIMFDTGLPASKGGKTLDRLAALNIERSKISAIYLTHGHFDHIGGLLDENGSPVFPNATIYISSEELSYIEQTMNEITSQLKIAYNEKLISFESGNLLPFNVLPISAKGHTPGHTAYQLGSMLFVGDLMHGPTLQFIDPKICASYDADRTQAISTRIQLLSYGITNSLTLLCAHAPGNGILF